MPPVTKTLSRSIPSRWLPVAVTLLIALTAVAYSPALRGPQLFDDFQTIQHNSSITHFATALTPPAATPIAGRPVVNLTLAFNYWLNTRLGVDQSPDPLGPSKTISYHVVNILLHICSGLLLLGIIRRTLTTERIPERWRTRADLIALGITAVWLLHPLQTEAVDYLTQRTELVVGCCYLATIYAAIRAWNGSWRWSVAAAVACLLGMGAKEVMASAPIMVLLYDRAFRYTAWRDLLAPAQRPRRRLYAALAASWVLLVALMIFSPRGPSVGFHPGVAWYEYLHSQGWAITHYLRLVLVPTRLSLDYDFHLLPHWRGIPGLIFLAALGAVTIAAWLRANEWGWAAFLGSWFFLILAPSSSVVPILTEIVAERRMYLPLAAVIVILAVLASQTLAFIEARMRLPKGSRLRPEELRLAGGLITVVVVILLGGMSYDRSGLYRDPEAIWRDAIAKVPTNPRAWNNLGVALANRPATDPTEAEGLYRTAVALDSSYLDALVNDGMTDLTHGNKTAAEPRFRRVLSLDSNNHYALGGLGTLLLARGDTAAALPLMERYAKVDAGSDFFATLGEIYLARHRGADAADAFRQAIERAPERTDLIVYLGGLLLQQHHPAAAEPYLEEAVRRQPAAGVNLALLSLALAGEGRAAESTDAAARAVKVNGIDQRAWFFAGRAMLDNHRPDLAATYFARAAELDPHDADALAELGEAKLALGDRQDAAAIFARALRIDPADSVARAGLARIR